MHNKEPDPTVQVAAYACPLINPPSQQGLFENKVHNIELALSRMRPLVLQPGQGFSFWAHALEPIEANGYREGAMLVNQRATTSVGGGLCQLSGLLYNLALLSGLRIDERHPHSIDAYGEDRYIPLGRDATVAWGYKDLCFENPYDFVLAFELTVNHQEARGRVTATQVLPAHISLEVELLQTVQAPERLAFSAGVPRGTHRRSEGLSGKTVRAWRVFTPVDGQKAGLASGALRRELLSLDCYRETPAVTLYGDWHAVPVSHLAMQAARSLRTTVLPLLKPVVRPVYKRIQGLRQVGASPVSRI